MQAAIKIAEANKTPFGAVLAMGDELFVSAAGRVKSLHNPETHAELSAIRKLGDYLQKTDLSGFALYSTCEPCPICMREAILAKIDAVFYGCDNGTVSEYLDQGQINSDTVIEQNFRSVQIAGGLLEERCYKLLKSYS